MGWFRNRDPEARAPGREVRDPKAATVRLQMTGPNMPIVPLWNADRATQIGYLGNVVAYRCIEVIAQAAAGVPLRAGVARPDGIAGVAEYNPKARLAQLLGPAGSPAPGWSASDFWSFLITQRYITGRDGAELELTDDAKIQALWPLTSARLDPIPTNGGSRPFARFEYGPWSDKRKLAVEQVFYGWFKHPDDWRQAKSPLISAATALSIAVQSDRYTDALLRNGNVPDTLIVLEEFADVEQREAYQRQWAATHSGAHNSGKVQFFEAERDADGKLGDAVAVHQLGMTSKDSRLIEQHREALQHIAIALGVPWSMLDASGRTFDNAKQEDLAFWQNTMVPLLGTLEGEINRDLAPRLGPEVGWFDLSNVEALRPLVSVGEAMSLAANGIITREEVRLRAGFAGPAPDIESEPTTEEVPDDSDVGAAGGEGGGAGEGGEASRSGLDAEGHHRQEARDPQEVETRVSLTEQIDRLDKLWRRTDGAFQAQEAEWRRKFRSLFDRQAKSTVKRLQESERKAKRAAEGRARPDEFFDPRFWRDETMAVAEDLNRALFTAAWAAEGARLGVSFGLLNEHAVEMILARSNQLAEGVTQTTYDAITAQLVEGVEAGEAIPDLAARIRQVFADASALRAETIARTEVVGGFNAATYAGLVSLPADVGIVAVEWIAARDSRTRPTHAHADGMATWMGTPFQVGGSSLLYPGDPNGEAKETVNCRCTLGGLTSESFAEKAALHSEATLAAPVPVERARVALALVDPRSFDEARFRRALEMAA